MKHKIINRDCRQALKALPEKSVHLVVTSPPYNIGIGWDNWKDSISQDEYLELTKTWLKECYRVLADGGIICINLPFNDNGNVAFLHSRLAQEIGFRFKTNIAWIKWDWKREEKFATSKWRLEKYKTPSQYHVSMINAYEIVLVMQKNHSYRTGKKDLTDYEYKKWKYNVWFIAPVKDRTHPAPYPLELVRRLIKLYSFVGDTVLDPFLGTGTTAKASNDLNRNSIGIELSSEYIEMAKNRIGYGSVSIEKHEERYIPSNPKVIYRNIKGVYRNCLTR